VLSFESYYHDPRFEQKKPNVKGTWRELCGDNMYYRDKNGEWRQHGTLYHRRQEEIEKDLKHPYVFIAEHFYYFGNKAVDIPSQYESLMWHRQGCKCNHDTETVEGFLKWLGKNFSPGVHGSPTDRGEAGSCEC
jgi:hypothetical protein